jgi:hypothetical protein
MKRLPIGVENFQELITEDYFLVDKTLLIKTFIEDGSKVILIPRPRRFGKTLNMSMLNYFFSIQHQQHADLFTDLAIAKHAEFCHKHQSQYPTIFFSLKKIINNTIEEAIKSIKQTMAELYQQHRYLLTSEQLFPEDKVFFNKILNENVEPGDLRNSLLRLITFLYKHHQKKVLVLIDEYDAPIHAGYKYGFFEEIILFMRTFFSEGLKIQDFLHKSLVTGILRVSQESIFSGLNNVECYSLLRSEYSEYFGFNENEVLELARQASVSIDISKIRTWYNGYHVDGLSLYNPWSIINCFKRNSELEPYWVNTSDNLLIKDLLGGADVSVKQALESLIKGDSIVSLMNDNLVFTHLKMNDVALWQLLFFSGYLTLNRLFIDAKGRRIAQLRIPNKEVLLLYQQMIEYWYISKTNTKSYEQLIKSLLNNQLDSFQKKLQDYINQVGSYFDFHSHTTEAVYQAFILGLVAGLADDYIINSNIETGDGRCDVLMIPRDINLQGFILEFKRDDSEENLKSLAEQALTQIINKKYVTKLKQQKVKSALALGIAFAGKKVFIAAKLLKI